MILEEWKWCTMRDNMLECPSIPTCSSYTHNRHTLCTQRLNVFTSCSLLVKFVTLGTKRKASVIGLKKATPLNIVHDHVERVCGYEPSKKWLKTRFWSYYRWGVFGWGCG